MAFNHSKTDIMNQDTIFSFVTILILGFVSGLAYVLFYQIIGAPMPKAVNDLQRRFPETEELVLTKPNMILRKYGEWLAAGQNAWNDKYNKSLLHSVSIPFSATAKSPFKALIKTSYGRGGDLASLWPSAISETGVKCLTTNQATGYIWNVVLKLLPGETCVINYYDESGTLKSSYSKPLFPDWKPSNMPISPYKALGLCPTCTAFYLCAFFTGCGYFIGLYPAAFLLLFPGAYAVSAWAITTVKI